MSTVRRSSVIKPGRPELKFAPTTPPRSTPVPLPTSTPSSTPPGGRNCSRGAAAARDRHQAAGAKGGHRPQIRRIAAPLFPSDPSISLPLVTALTCPSPLSVLCTGSPPGPRRRSSVPAGEPEHAAEEPRCPSTHNSAPSQPEHSAADSDPRRRPEPARGERTNHHRAAGAVAPPI